MQADGQHRSAQAATHGPIKSVRVDAAIIGGGPAGSVAASLLAAKGWKVLLMDKACFPRNKVCGEFLSPAVWPFFKALGIAPKILELQGTKVTQAHFTGMDGKETEIPLPGPDKEHPYGYGLSRNRLDEFLLCAAEARGCKIAQASEVREIQRIDSGFLVSGHDFSKKSDFSIQTGIVLNAAGRFSRWRKSSSEKSTNPAKEKICFKTHFQADGRHLPGHAAARGQNKQEQADGQHLPGQAAARGQNKQVQTDGGLKEKVRIILFRGGYLGMLGVEGGLVNVCGTVSERRFKQAGSDFDQLLHEISGEQSYLREWLPKASRSNPWLSCGPQIHQFRGGFKDGIFYAGDAACSYEPFMGQGMTMAIAGAFLFSDLAGKAIPSGQTLKMIGGLYHRKFERMLRPKMHLGNLLNFMTGGFDKKAGWKEKLLFHPKILKAGLKKACEIPFSGYRNTWPGDDAPQWPKSTAREPAEIPR